VAFGESAFEFDRTSVTDLLARTAMAHVVKVDFRQVSECGQPLESPGDRVRVWRFAILPAEQPAVVVVIRPEFLGDVCA
jgi:hypothetical protein